ncbi:hypothetical protein GHT06_007517 [Daphnia sinensis]|uniref:Uncharacterized protein n=1 Tax=Daphnia sinensis TaxID=1820382 RepID=A0AAD5PME5_9CRUS|nr:hypothetical protein GHT06_007517 [Daphnia sinensis]
MRSGSNSAPRTNVPFGTGMGYQQPQQPYYNGNQPYGNQGPKMGSYDNRSHSPYHHNKPYSQNYGNRPHHGGYYNGPQDRGSGYGGGYGEQMMGNNPGKATIHSRWVTGRTIQAAGTISTITRREISQECKITLQMWEEATLQQEWGQIILQ